jgi:hypothetical protein
MIQLGAIATSGMVGHYRKVECAQNCVQECPEARHVRGETHGMAKESRKKMSGEMMPAKTAAQMLPS